MIYAFENCEFDLARGELRRGGMTIPVEPQVFALLKLLIESRDRMLSRDEIFDTIWGSRIVSDATLSSRLRDARKAIGDDGKNQRFIRTIQRRGLRFVATVCKRSAVAPEPIVPLLGTSKPPPTTASQIFRRPAIAVLPFEHCTDDSADMFLSRGLSEQIIGALSAWRYFPVLSWPAPQYDHHPTTEGPGVDRSIYIRYQLGGTFHRFGDRIKVTLALTDVEEGRHIWSHMIKRSVDELAELDEEIAMQIATLILPELTGVETRRITRKSAENMTAWEFAMRAAWLTHRGKKSDFDEAEMLAEKAMERAPGWAFPYTLIAVGKFQKAMQGFSASDSRSAFSETLIAARTALEVDSTAWHAHALCAVGELWSNRNHERALAHIERAIDLNPGAGANYHFGGCIRGFSGDPAGAREYQERLFRIDPTYHHAGVVEADLGLWHLLEEQFQEADYRIRRAHEQYPRYGRALQRQIALAGIQNNRAMASTAAKKLSALGLSLDIDKIMESYPFRDPDHSEYFVEGLCRSGVMG